MLNTVRTSLANKDKITELTNQLGLGTENVIARLAIGLSLSKGKLNITSIQDSKGKEFRARVLLGDYERIYIGLVCELYGIHTSNTEIPRYLKLHLDHGLKLIFDEFQESRNEGSIDFFMKWFPGKMI